MQTINWINQSIWNLWQALDLGASIFFLWFLSGFIDSYPWKLWAILNLLICVQSWHVWILTQIIVTDFHLAVNPLILILWCLDKMWYTQNLPGIELHPCRFNLLLKNVYQESFFYSSDPLTSKQHSFLQTQLTTLYSQTILISHSHSLQSNIPN